jgi:hypothetical protein
MGGSGGGWSDISRHTMVITYISHNNAIGIHNLTNYSLCLLLIPREFPRGEYVEPLELPEQTVTGVVVSAEVEGVVSSDVTVKLSPYRCQVRLLCYAMLCFAYAMLCFAMLCYALPMICYAMLCYAMLCYAMLCYAVLCYVMLCYAMLCYAMLCYAMLCFAYDMPMLCHQNIYLHHKSIYEYI